MAYGNIQNTGGHRAQTRNALQRSKPGLTYSNRFQLLTIEFLVMNEVSL
jgi:hypothetical protein